MTQSNISPVWAQWVKASDRVPVDGRPVYLKGETTDKMGVYVIGMDCFYGHDNEDYIDKKLVQWLDETPPPIAGTTYYGKHLERMMNESHKAMVERKPSWEEVDTITAQARTMDAFIEHVVPYLKSIEDLRAFISLYLERKPSV